MWNRLLRAAAIAAGAAVWLAVAPRRAGEPRHFGDETACIRGLQQIHRAEVQYSSRYGHFAGSLPELEPLLDPEVAGGERQGCHYLIRPTKSGYEVLAIGSGVRFTSGQTMGIRRIP